MRPAEFFLALASWAAFTAVLAAAVLSPWAGRIVIAYLLLLLYVERLGNATRDGRGGELTPARRLWHSFGELLGTLLALPVGLYLVAQDLRRRPSDTREHG